MFFNWPKLQSIAPYNIDVSNNIVITLIEHNGPLLFITKEENRYYLNYLIDESENEEERRFLHLPISHMKLRALVTQGITLYECLKSENIYIYDLNLKSEIIFYSKIKFEDLDLKALPIDDELLPKLSEDAINKVFGFKSEPLCFILSNDSTKDHTMAFEKLSKYLENIQKVASETTSFYCDTNNIKMPYDTELRVTTYQAASFAINANSSNKLMITAIQDVLPKYTNMLLKSNHKEIYDLLDSIPTNFAKSLFSYFNLILNNKYETIIKVDNRSVYLNSGWVKEIKKNVNAANYIREEFINATGYLIGGNIKTNYFYFIAKEDEQTYRGRLSEEYTATHPNLTLSETSLREAKFKLSIEFKFNSFEKKYELLELSEEEDK